MKVLLFNGSPKAKGCTFTALSEVAKTLEENGVEAEIIHIGGNVLGGCKSCGFCGKTGKCVTEDVLNQVMDKVKGADGYVFGSPVHYASASGDITSFLDRLFITCGSAMAYKPGCVVCSCRRGGASATFDQLNKYFSINNMPIVSANYWNQVHGNTPEEVLKDEEGMQTMRYLGRNMAWILKCIDTASKNGVAYPDKEAKIKTNYIR